NANGGGINAELRAGASVVRFTRNWSQIVVDGTPVVLDAPVRVKEGRWLVPKSFLTDVVPRLALASAAPPAAAPAATALEEMRVRSYPTFTRVVLETSAPVSHKVDGVDGATMRVRVAGLAGRARSEEVNDGFVDSVKLGTVGKDAVLLVSFTGAGGELRASALSDPPRLVLDFMKPVEAMPRET